MNVDELIEMWHDGDSPLPLHEYLGMTVEEYDLFVRFGTLPEGMTNDS